MTGKLIKQDNIQELVHTTARVLIATYFMAKSTGLVLDPYSMHQIFSATNMPVYLMWPHIAFELLAAIAILIGFQIRLAGGCLALHLFWTSFIINYVPGDAVAIGAFWRDLAMIGGLMMFVSHGAGRYAVDNRRNERLMAEAAEADEESEAVAEVEDYMPAPVAAHA